MSRASESAAVVAWVAGATGYVGREVVRALCDHGCHVFAHVRPDSPRKDEWTEQFTGLGARVETTSWQADALSERLGDLAPSVVFSLLGTTRKRGKKTGDTYESVDVGLTLMLLEAARRCQRHPRFVYLSSLGTRPGTRNRYLAARARCEAAIVDSGLPYAIARPSFITGPDRDDRRPGERIGAAVADGALHIAGLFGATKTPARYRSTTNRALADALVHIALAPTSASRVYESEELR